MNIKERIIQLLHKYEGVRYKMHNSPTFRQTFIDDYDINPLGNSSPTPL